MNEHFKQYEAEPHPWWKVAQYSGMDAYDTMEQANRRGWHEIAAWGTRGWDLGSWPLVIVYFRTFKDKEGTVFYQIAEYVEGDITMYSCPTEELRTEIVDEIAFYHWQAQEQTWVRGIETFEDVPDTLKGRYRRE